MRKIFKTALYAASALALATACDTSEEALYPGTSGGIQELTISPTGIVYLTADGSPQKLTVKGNTPWTASFKNPQSNLFSLEYSQESDTLTIIGSGNYEGDSARKDTIAVKPLAGTTKYIFISQSALSFAVPELKDTTISEDGGTIDFEFRITTDWFYKTDPENADLSWLRFSPEPNSSGIFPANRDSIGKIIVTPNYNDKENSVSLQFYPADKEVAKRLSDQDSIIKKEFKIKQKPGSKPTNVRGDMAEGSIKYREAQYTLSYESKTPIKSCGVYIHGEGLGNDTIREATSTEGFPLSGSVTVNLIHLTDYTAYTVRPFVENMVGLTVGGDETVSEFRTLKDPENDRFAGISIKQNSIVVSPDTNSVEISLTAEADVPLGSAVMTLTDSAGTQIGNDIPCPVDGSVSQQALKFNSGSILDPNSKYTYTITIKVKDTEDNRIATKEITESGSFKTLTMGLGENDNPTPEVK